MTTSTFVDELQKRIIQGFMDVLILTEMRKNSLSGYDAIGLIHRKFGVLVSSGTVYSLLYSLEREGWIEGVLDHRKRVYVLAEKGKQQIKTIAKANDEIRDLLRNISLLNVNPAEQMQATQ
jgi:DNA-binding PadR family transcriptional regulator